VTGRLDITAVASPADQLGVVRVLIAGVIAVLALIGLINLITASMVGLRDHLRDVRVLRVMGLTPFQVPASLVAHTSVLALVAVTAGVSLGLAVCTGLSDLAGWVYGLDGIGRPPGILTLAVVIAGLTAVVPERRNARVPEAAVHGPLGRIRVRGRWGSAPGRADSAAWRRS
jgi:putative ABC transport system permease protein